MNAEAFRFKLFPDVDFVAIRNRAESHSDRDFSWFGYIPGDQYGRVIVSVLSSTMGVLITRQDGVAGNNFFNVIDVTCLGGLTFAHEIGHQFGLSHDWYTWEHVDGFTLPQSWDTASDAHGYVQFSSSDENVRSLMSYGLHCKKLGVQCRRIPRWSNPADLSLNNLPFGIWQGLPYPSNEVAAINRARLDVANNRLSACRLLSQC